jgi:CheY-like chemotaxis protein
MLKRHGARVTAVESATAARQAMAASPPTVILSDIGLPGEDGYMFIARLRESEQDENRPRVPAIALTAFAGMHDRARVLSAGFDYHMSKPLEAQALMTLLAGFAPPSDNA